MKRPLRHLRAGPVVAPAAGLAPLSPGHHASKRRAVGDGVTSMTPGSGNPALRLSHLVPRDHLPSPDSVGSHDSFGAASGTSTASAEHPGISPSSLALSSPEQPLPRGAASVRALPLAKGVTKLESEQRPRSRRRTRARIVHSPVDDGTQSPDTVMSLRAAAAVKLHAATDGKVAKPRRSGRLSSRPARSLDADSSSDTNTSDDDEDEDIADDDGDARSSKAGATSDDDEDEDDEADAADDDEDGTESVAAASTTRSRRTCVRRHARRRRKSGGGRSATRRNLPTDAIEVLKAWMLHPRHINHPYPTDQEKEDLSVTCDINMKQLTNWFTNARKRMWAPMMRRLGKDIVSFNNKSHVVMLTDTEKRQMADSSGVSEEAFAMAVEAELRRERSRGNVKSQAMRRMQAEAAKATMDKLCASRRRRSASCIAATPTAAVASPAQPVGAQPAGAAAEPAGTVVPEAPAQPSVDVRTVDTGRSVITNTVELGRTTPQRRRPRPDRRVDMTSRDGLLVGTPRSDQLWSPPSSRGNRFDDAGAGGGRGMFGPNGVPTPSSDVATFGRGFGADNPTRSPVGFHALFRHRGLVNSVAWRNKELCASPSAAVPMFMPGGDATRGLASRFKSHGYEARRSGSHIKQLFAFGSTPHSFADVVAVSPAAVAHARRGFVANARVPRGTMDGSDLRRRSNSEPSVGSRFMSVTPSAGPLGAGAPVIAAESDAGPKPEVDEELVSFLSNLA